MQKISDQFKLFGVNLNVRVELVTGGVDSTNQSVSLTELPHIIVATPGRLADLLRSTDLRLNKVKFFVMDEADRLLDRDDGDFTDDLATIIEKLPSSEKRQTLMYSATLSETITEAREQASTAPFFWQSEELAGKTDDVVIMPEKLEQKYVLVPEDVKDGYLIHMVKLLIEERLEEKEQIIIFSRTCKSVQVRSSLSGEQTLTISSSTDFDSKLTLTTMVVISVIISLILIKSSLYIVSFRFLV